MPTNSRKPAASLGRLLNGLNAGASAGQWRARYHHSVIAVQAVHNAGSPPIIPCHYYWLAVQHPIADDKAIACIALPTYRTGGHAQRVVRRVDLDFHRGVHAGLVAPGGLLPRAIVT